MAVDFDSYSFFDGTDQTAVTQITWSNYWRGVIPDGVVANVGDEMKVYGYSGGMVVKVAAGACMVDNHRGVLNSEKEMPIEAAHATKPRIDLIVARVIYGNTDSKIELDVKKGTAANTPVAPTLVQSTGSTYEIKLAEVYVDPAVLTITAEKVTDFRNVFECGEQAFAFRNVDSVALTKGTIVTLVNDQEGGVRKCHAAELPIGVVRSTSITPGAAGQIDTKPGTISDVKCDSNAVKIGDALIVGDIDGTAKSGGGFAVGLALQAKAAGIISNVKSLLTVFSRLPFQNAWYIVDGILEEQVIAAYQFVNRGSAAEALININNSNLQLPLSYAGSAVTWDTSTGFYFPNNAPNNAECRLTNETLSSALSTGLLKKIRAAAFGFKNGSGTADYAGGICMGLDRALLIKGGEASGGSAAVVSPLGAPAVYHGQTVTRKATVQPTNGVLSANWNSAASDDTSNPPSIFADGANVTGSTNYIMTQSERFGGVVGQADFGINPVVPFYMTAVVFYNTALTADQHLQLASNISALGGI